MNSCRGAIIRSGIDPAIRTRIVSAAGVSVAGVITAPNNHFAPCPNGRLRPSGRGRVRRAGSCPTVRDRVVPSTRVRAAGGIRFSTPDDHLSSRPYCRVKISPIGGVIGGGSGPSICVGVVSPASVQVNEPAPDDHVTTGPDRGVILSAIRRISRAGSRPAIGARVIPAAGV